MFNVLLVDDERTILEGISMIVNWEKCGVRLTGTASNGIEALELIQQKNPDIVISDIAMPGMDGISLLEKSKSKAPNIEWILLSGYNEFDYAQRAMKHGVMHYLLKPCNENLIMNAIVEVVKKLEKNKRESNYLKSIEEELTTFDKEAAARRCLLKQEVRGETDVQLLNIFDLKADQPLRLLSFIEVDKIDGKIRELSKVCSAFFGASFLTMIEIEKQLFILIKDKDVNMTYLKQRIKNVLSYDIDFIVSETGNVEQLPHLYKATKSTLEQITFYQQKKIVYDIHAENEQSLMQRLAEKKELILEYLQKNSYQKSYENVLEVMTEAKEKQINPNLIKPFFAELLAVHIKYINSLSSCLSDVFDFTQLDSCKEYEEVFSQLYTQLLKEPISQGYKYSLSVRSMLQLIEEHFQDEQLSLQWIAHEKMFMNADYLGKNFKKEVGHKFSAYVTTVRIEKAVEIIQNEPDIKVFELAERTGFGHNPQYFSQIFKKVTGSTPKELIRSQ
ncbi:putative response regulator [Bacillus sp. TS-2]|nr:putative response regulator [Bacillus sp. TS-2]